ncbi:hypothetical protein DFH11DRAFT_1727151 [Phellopilus nigrolimitatus]|nr:hypothetical protein DFH11DRAFT_1727151 [Phellopilus nigrolimitatus]
MPRNSGKERIAYPRTSTNAQSQATGCRVYPIGTPTHDHPTTQTSDLDLAIDQHRPSLPPPSHPANLPNHPRPPDDSSHSSKISPPPQPRKLVSTTPGMEKGITRGHSHEGGRSRYEKFSL